MKAGADPNHVHSDKSNGYLPVEDRALKLAAQFFGKELLPLLGEKTRVKRIAPTEQIHLEMKDFFEDFNFEMEDGSWRHFEFESDQITAEDLRRFRAYEAVAGYYYGVEVITSVVCTSAAKILKDELHQGINVFRVNVLRLKDDDADEVISRLEEKQKRESLDRGELVKLLLTPFMSGNMAQTDRIAKSTRMIKKEREKLGKEDTLRMESVLYAFAVKFLTKNELNSLEEVFRMTELGRLLEERGKEIGKEIGKRIGKEIGKEQVNQLNRKLLSQNRTEDMIRSLNDEEYQKRLFKEFGI